MSSDPAVNAAEKVWDTGYAAYSNGRPFNPDDALADALIAAAREALEPLRKLHRKRRAGGETYCAECCQLVPVMGGHDLIYQPWPCATATLIYPAEELR